MKFQSTKVYDGFSTCFRQWKAVNTHCSFLHGYGTSFKVIFEGELDECNWVFDFGGMKRATHKIDGMNPKEYFSWLLDHTTIIAEDDPHLDAFKKLEGQNLIQLRVMPKVGCEHFARFLLDKINTFLQAETDGRVKAVSLEFMENSRNSAIAYLND